MPPPTHQFSSFRQFFLNLPNGLARSRAAYALGKIGPAAKAAVPALIEALEDRRVHQAAARALRKIEGR